MKQRTSSFYEPFGLITQRRGKRGERRIQIIELLKEAHLQELRTCENGSVANSTLTAYSASSAPPRYLTKTRDYRPKCGEEECLNMRREQGPHHFFVLPYFLRAMTCKRIGE